MLRHRLGQLPKVDLRWGQRLTGLQQDGDAVRLTCDTAADHPRSRWPTPLGPMVPTHRSATCSAWDSRVTATRTCS